MTAVISAQKLSKFYSRTRLALDNVSFQVNSGEIYGFIGGNGTGKTTTIKILTGLISPSSGQAFIFGYPAGSKKAKEKIGYLPEVSNYHLFMKAGKLLDFYSSLNNMESSTRKKKIPQILELVGLKGNEDIPLKEFSKGMLQRFGLAQCLIADTPLLILDEPTSGLDPLAQKEMKEILLRLKEEGKTIFFSSHQLSEVESICDRIGILKEGKLIADQPISTLLTEEKRFRLSVKLKIKLEQLTEKFSAIITSKKENIFQLTIPEEVLNPFLRFIQEYEGEILNIEPCKTTLEDVFVRVTREWEKHET